MLVRTTSVKRDHVYDGVKVCDRWKSSYRNFLADMGPRPHPASEYSLDRWPNNAGNYEPGNCRWATAKQQQNNRRPQPRIDWIEALSTASGIPYRVLYPRVYKVHPDVAKAIAAALAR